LFFAGWRHAHHSKWIKVFLLLFLQKKKLFLAALQEINC